MTTRFLLTGWLLLAASLPTALAQQTPATPPTEEAPRVSQADALEAWDRFRQAPEQHLDLATTFLRFMQGGSVHTVLRSDVLFWMYAPYPPDVQAVLYAAYMGGNLDSQLRGKRQGDDPEAGIAAALDAWAGVKKTHPTLDIPRLDELAKARREGRLAAALDGGTAPAQP